MAYHEMTPHTVFLVSGMDFWKELQRNICTQVIRTSALYFYSKHFPHWWQVYKMFYCTNSSFDLGVNISLSLDNMCSWHYGISLGNFLNFDL